jgi:hypothetical protein
VNFNRRKSSIRRNKIYDGYKSFNFNNLRAIRRIRRIRRKYDGLNSGLSVATEFAGASL